MQVCLKGRNIFAFVFLNLPVDLAGNETTPRCTCAPEPRPQTTSSEGQGTRLTRRAIKMAERSHDEIESRAREDEFQL